MVRTAWYLLDEWTLGSNCRTTIGRRSCIFNMCTVWPYLHSMCACEQICIFISRRFYLILFHYLTIKSNKNSMDYEAFIGQAWGGWVGCLLAWFYGISTLFR